jgi:hypothetical protein
VRNTIPNIPGDRTDRHQCHINQREGLEDHTPPTGLLIHRNIAPFRASDTRTFPPNRLLYQYAMQLPTIDTDLIESREVVLVRAIRNDGTLSNHTRPILIVCTLLEKTVPMLPDRFYV